MKTYFGQLMHMAFDTLLIPVKYRSSSGFD